jgi:NADH-quinone oxidoreductase subunit H
MSALFSILIFPGFLFVAILSFFAEYADRKLHARLQNRVGPPWFQPFADFIKLVSKEEIIPTAASATIFWLAPVFALTSVVTAYLYIPLWDTTALFSFDGDIIVVLYLLTIPTLAIFIGGWYSSSLYARIGSVRAIMQLFAYEIPLFMGILSSALLAGSWSLNEIMIFYSRYPALLLCNLIGFSISLIALLGKLEKVPFDIPEAETEIVAGSFTEYSGRFLALFRLALNIEMVAGVSLLAAIFFPLGLSQPLWSRVIIYFAEILFIIGLIALLRTIFARLRIDQMVRFCWKYMVPLGVIQLLINLFVKGILLR